MRPIVKGSVAITLLAVILWMTASFNTEPDSCSLYGDLDCNGYREKYILKNQQIQVLENGKQIWHSPGQWQVKQLILADVDNNKQKEILLVLWKKGSFGKSKPFWFQGADNEYTCHLFVYKTLAGRVKEIWCSSALEFPIIKLDVSDSNDDGLNELNVVEGPRSGFAYPFRQYFVRQESKWIWDNWGFSKISRQPDNYLMRILV